MGDSTKEITTYGAAVSVVVTIITAVIGWFRTTNTKDK